MNTNKTYYWNITETSDGKQAIGVYETNDDGKLQEVSTVETLKIRVSYAPLLAYPTDGSKVDFSTNVDSRLEEVLIYGIIYNLSLMFGNNVNNKTLAMMEKAYKESKMEVIKRASSGQATTGRIKPHYF